MLILVLQCKPPANSVAGRHARCCIRPKPRGRRTAYVEFEHRHRQTLSSTRTAWPCAGKSSTRRRLHPCRRLERIPQPGQVPFGTSLPDTTHEPDPAWLTSSTSTLSDGAQCFFETTTESPHLPDLGVVLPHRLRMTLIVWPVLDLRGQPVDPAPQATVQLQRRSADEPQATGRARRPRSGRDLVCQSPYRRSSRDKRSGVNPGLLQAASPLRMSRSSSAAGNPGKNAANLPTIG